MYATGPTDPSARADAVGQAIVIYDPDCGFCSWSLSLLLRADRHGALRPLALGTDRRPTRCSADLDPAAPRRVVASDRA